MSVSSNKQYVYKVHAWGRANSWGNRRTLCEQFMAEGAQRAQHVQMTTDASDVKCKPCLERLREKARL